MGGIIFGTLGDRYGRKFVLMATILLMGVASTLIGVLPTYASAGIWAPILLVGCRLLQGLGAGAEQAGAAVLMAEYAPAKRRGYFAALPFMGVLLGTVMAAAIYFALVRVEDISQSWLWRVPFLLSVLIIAVAIWIRLKLKESPSFAKLEARHQINDSPLKHLIKHSKPTLLKVIGMRMAENGGSSIYQSLAISYMATATGLKGPIGPIALLLAGVSGAVIIPLTGKLSDRFGRIPVYRAFAIVSVAARLSDVVGAEPGQRDGQHRDAVRRARGRLGHVRDARRAVARTLRRAAPLRGRRRGSRSIRGDRGRGRAADRSVDHRVGDCALGRQRRTCSRVDSACQLCRHSEPDRCRDDVLHA